jgi:hypothetical protein
MQKWLLRFFFSIIGVACFATLYPPNRAPNAYHVSGDTFRSYADFAFDELSSVDPRKVTFGSTIFIKTDYLGKFFKEIHPQINCKYIIISHNSDCSSPGPYISFLNDDKIIAWFAQNIDTIHPKLHPIPIGIANRCWVHGNSDILTKISQKKFVKSHLLYLNISVSTFSSERSLVYNLFKKASYCFYSYPKDFSEYLIDLGSSEFVLSPRGNGLDTHRLWEALYMGSFPIVKTSTLDSLYEDLPVVIIQDWNEVTEAFLDKKYKEMSSKKFSFEKLDAAYWFKLIDSFKE